MLIDTDDMFADLSADLSNELRQIAGQAELSKYEMDPHGFITDVLGETLTPDLDNLCNAVLDNQFVIAKSANAVGKTFLAARIAAWFYLCRDKVQVYTAAAPPEDNLKRLLWGEIGSLYFNHRSLFKGSSKAGLFISRSPLDFIAGVTIPSSGTREERVAKFSGKHRPHLMFLLDEADAIPDEVYEGIETCISGGTMVRVLLMFNPRSATGEVYRKEISGTAKVVRLEAFNHPNVLTGNEVIPGAVTRDRTVYRINEYCRLLLADEEPGTDCFELPDFLSGASTIIGDHSTPPLKPGWYKPTEPSFSYMVLARYPAQSSSQLISREWIDAAVERFRRWEDTHGDKPPQRSCIMGADVAEMGNDLNVLTRRYGPLVAWPQSWVGVDIDITQQRLLTNYRRRTVEHICVDGTGVGAGIAPWMLRHGATAYSVKVAGSPTKRIDIGEFKILRDELAWAVREWVRRPDSMMPYHTRLIEEMTAFDYEVRDGKVRVTKADDIRDRIKRSPDNFWSLAMTFYEPVPLFSAWAGKGRR